MKIGQESNNFEDRIYCHLLPKHFVGRTCITRTGMKFILSVCNIAGDVYFLGWEKDTRIDLPARVLGLIHMLE